MSLPFRAFGARTRLILALLCALPVTGVVFFALSGSAHSAGACDPAVTGKKTWLGGAASNPSLASASNDWSNGANWSGGTAPGMGAHVCIPASNGVPGGGPIITSGTVNISDLEAHQDIQIAGGTFNLNNAGTPSTSANVFELQGGTLGGQGQLPVPGTFQGDGGSTMDGKSAAAPG